LGLIAEGGKLIHLHNTFLRKSIPLNKERIIELLGNILWYISNLADLLEIKMDEVAAQNLKKVQNIWKGTSRGAHTTALFDAKEDPDEQIPKKFTVLFEQKIQTDLNTGESKTFVKISTRGVFIGDRLTDNSIIDDGYRFHDIFHFAHAAVLGWSPVVRSMLKRKRKSNPDVDEKQDGARAIIIEEAIAALNYEYAKNHYFFTSHSGVEHSHYQQIIALARNLEVNRCSHLEWENAIVQGAKIFAKLKENKGGIIEVNLDKRKISYLKRPAQPS
jgi:hypothetical protein